MSGWNETEAGLPSFEDLTTAGRERDPAEVIEQARAAMGLAPRLQPPQEPAADVRELRKELGI
jgi:hypothetical protein